MERRVSLSGISIASDNKNQFDWEMWLRAGTDFIMQILFAALKNLLSFLIVLSLSASTIKDGVQSIELNEVFTTRIGQNHTTQDGDFTFRISKIVTLIRNDAVSVDAQEILSCGE